MEITSCVPKTERAPQRQAWFWKPGLIVFISSASIMVLELVAGRIIAPHVGVSLYTWTSVIGVILAGMSLGNYAGGWLADRRASFRLLGILFVLGSVLSLWVIAVDQLDIASQVEWSLLDKALLVMTALFLPAATILGMISPMVAKLAVRDLSRAGRTVGAIYAAGAIGSIVGTLITGFLLIAVLGTYAIVTGVAAVLLLFGLLLLFGTPESSQAQPRSAKEESGT